VKVHFYAMLRDHVGGAAVELDLEPGSSALELIELVVAKHPTLDAALLDKDRHLHKHMKMFINGREVVYLEAQFDYVLQPTDKVDIFPPVAGG